MCRPKEPHFFCTDLPGLAEVPDSTAYDALFDEAPEGACLGEASAFYLMSSDAPARIKAANPDARIILSIRNPAQAAHSLFHQLRDGFREDQTTFEAAWNLQADRAQGKSLPSYCPEPRQLQYREVYSYADQVARYLEVFGPDRVLVLLFEEIAQSPQEVIDRVLTFLDLPPFPTAVELPRKNARRTARFPWLTQLISAPPAVLRPFVSPTKWVLNKAGVKPSVVMMKHLSRKSTNAPAPEALTPEFKKQLADAFASDLDRLEGVIGRDLSAWRQS